MRLSRKSDYALRAISHLSKLPKDQLGSINSVSAAETVPREFLAKILKDLTRSGLLLSFQGVTGGYKLARPAREITYLDVIEAIDGPIHLNLCTEGKHNCAQYDVCDMKDFWIKQEKMFKTALGKRRFGKYNRKKKK